MKTIYLYTSLLYGLSATVAQSSTTTDSSVATDATDSATSTNLSLETAYVGQSTLTATLVTEVSSTITSTDATGGTSLITTSYAYTTTQTISGTSSAISTSTTDASSLLDTNSDVATSSTFGSGSPSSTTPFSITPSSFTPSTSSTATTTSSTHMTLPVSTDASSYLAFAFPSGAPQPTWATGEYYTMLASAIYSVDRSFIQQPDYQTILSAIESAADQAGDQVSASVESSAWGWGAVTTNDWYQSAVPTALQSDVLEYNSAWYSAVSSVQALAVATTTNSGPTETAAVATMGAAGVGGAATSLCPGMMMAGVVAGIAAAVVLM
ncbi:hypothetical protein BJ166DRAFT_593758 [Pestalotiopsis sp. NC0098]|nr:hypothetical protein BJ166DRAFT_593758 [Pestalotiopsis sp. NC0098]